MANPLAKSIMSNISKKKMDDSYKSIDKDNKSSIKNINEKEEEILKSILYKNKTKLNLNILKKENSTTTKSEKQVISNKSTDNKSKKTSIKELANKKEINDNSNNTNSKDKSNKKIISLRDLAK